MPKRLPIKELVEFRYAYRLGTDMETQETKYEDVKVGKGQFIALNNTKVVEAYGNYLDYDGQLLIEVNRDVLLIDNFTKLWVSVVPVTTLDDADYEIVAVDPPRDGLIIVYLRSRAYNHKTLWYLRDGAIYEINVSFDIDVLTATVPYNRYFPITEETKVWYTQPADAGDKNSLIHLVGETKMYGYKKFLFEATIE